MTKNIYEELLRKHTLDELKVPKRAELSLEVEAPVSAERSLETITSSTSVLPSEKVLSAPVTSPKKYHSSDYGAIIPLIWWTVMLGVIFGSVYMSKRDLQYEFDGYIGKEKVHFYETLLQNTDRLEIEKENGTKILYISKWSTDDLVDKVVSVNYGEEVIICDNDSCLGEATKIALEYKSKILEEKKKKFNESLKE